MEPNNITQKELGDYMQNLLDNEDKDGTIRLCQCQLEWCASNLPFLCSDYEFEEFKDKIKSIHDRAQIITASLYLFKHKPSCMFYKFISIINNDTIKTHMCYGSIVQILNDVFNIDISKVELNDKFLKSVNELKEKTEKINDN